MSDKIKIIRKIIKPKDNFPNNPKLPLLIYKHAFEFEPGDNIVEKIEETFKGNGWQKLWRNRVYDEHHYHDNTHETLGIYQGRCIVQIGGESGELYTLEKGDVVIIPAGVSHKSPESTVDFKCVGAYPFDTIIDLKHGRKNEREMEDERIKQARFPETDPVYGENGPLFKYWKE